MVLIYIDSLKATFGRWLASAWVLAIVVSAFSLGLPTNSAAQVRRIYDRGSTGLGQLLKRLQTTASALHTAAHPDDEDSGLLAYLARKEQARTAYLSLNRGEGGQNVIGDELFEQLGIIRTEELLQARRLDGADQFFTRSMDYGFSKTRAEAARMWSEREILSDIVRVIRLYRPMVVISRFSGTTADGHGHHQMAGYLTPLAFRAAGDPEQFREHFAEGLEPWRPLKLYFSQGFAANPQNEPTLFLNTGEFDHLIGRSYFEIAMEGRSQHKSQEMGVLELRGAQRSGLRLAESSVSTGTGETSIFSGIDTSLTGIGDLTGDRGEALAAKLKELRVAAEAALREYDIYAPEKLVPELARGYRLAVEAETLAKSNAAKQLLRQKQDEFSEALQMAGGIEVDALSTVEMLNPGGSANVSVRVFTSGRATVTVRRTQLHAPEGWRVSPSEAPAAPQGQTFRPRNESSLSASFFTVTVPAGADPTEPYWLRRPRSRAQFDWTDAGDAKNLPFARPEMMASATLDVGGAEITVQREVQYRYAHDVRGEIRRSVNVVPAITLGLESDLLIVPISNRPVTRRVVATLRNNTTGPITGSASLELPAGWKMSPAAREFSLSRIGDTTAAAFDVVIPGNTPPGSYRLMAFAESSGIRFNARMQEIAYPHIQTHRIFSEPRITAEVLDLKVEPVRVGYIMGSGDRVPEAIRRMGLEVTMLGEKDLATGDLSAFDTIIVGIRASQARPDFVANNGRLLDYARNGGTLIVQYQQHEYVQNSLPPYPASMTAVTRGNQRISNLRVTDENAKVNILVPAHALFNFPNKIVDSDWENWVQERNLYCFTEFDARYTPLLESHDDGEDENKGGMLYAELGKGRYLYTSYSWFRQLPAGNPGAYRIFANILSLPRAKR